MFWLITLGTALLLVLLTVLRWRGLLSFGDCTNIALFLLAVVSLYIAAVSYNDANESASKQQAALDASRKSLDAVSVTLEKQLRTLEESRIAFAGVVETAKEQQRLLHQAVQTARSQLQVLEAEQKRQLEQPDIHAVIVYPAKPAIILENRSRIKPVKDAMYQLITLNVDRWLGDRYQLVQTVSTPVNYVRPQGSYLPSTLELRLDPSQPLVAGNRLYGYLTVDCPECVSRRIYWVYLKFGEEGWFREVRSGEQNYTLSVLAQLSPATVETHLRQFGSGQDLIPIRARLW